MSEPQAIPAQQAGSAPESAGEPASAEREAAADLSLRDLMAKAIEAQGKVEPDAVFAAAELVDLEDEWREELAAIAADPGPADVPPLDESQEELEFPGEMNRPDWA